MKRRRRYFLLLLLTMVSGYFAAWISLGSDFRGPSRGLTAAAQGASHDWPMFHKDEVHTGVAPGSGRIAPDVGPAVRWQYRVFDEPPADNLKDVRWTSGFPLGDLDGDGSLEVVVTTPDMGNYLVQLDGQTMQHRVIVLRDHPGPPPSVEVSWIYTTTIAPGAPGLDTYSPALVDADGDDLLDVVFTGRDKYVRALKGTTGALIWEFNMERITEAGPVVADVDSDHNMEIVVVTDCEGDLPPPVCPDVGKGARLYVLPAIASGTNVPLWSLDYPFKMDSAEPAVADLNPSDGENRKAIIAGTWGGELLVAWRDASDVVVTNTLKLVDLDSTIPISPTEPPVIRSTPLVWDFGEGPTAIFGWLPTDANAADARTSAIGLLANYHNGTLAFTPRWTIDQYDTWKSSATLVPQASGPPLVLFGYGLGVGPPPVQSNVVGRCDPGFVTGGVVALDWQGSATWYDDYGGAEGNLRGSAATADIDGDGEMEVVIPAGCFGKLHAYSAGGGEEWSLQLGPRTQSSPSIGDLDGDGQVEIVLGSYDGLIWALGSSTRNYLPMVVR